MTLGQPRDYQPLSTWARDLLVLRHLVGFLHEGRLWGRRGRYPLTHRDVAIEAHLDNREVEAAIIALARAAPPLVVTERIDRDIVIHDVTERALVLTGAWPSPNSTVDALIAALDEAIESASDDDTRSRLTRFRDGAVGVGREVLISVLTTKIGGLVG